MKQLIFGIHAVQAKLATSLSDAVLWVDDARQDKRIATCVNQAKAQQVKVRLVPKEKLASFVQGTHQGVVLEYINPIAQNEKALEQFLATLDHPPFLLILDGVTDPHNLGACLRSANGAGVDAVIAPKDKSASLTSVAIKVASGATETTPFFQVSNLARVLRQLADAGIWLVGTDDKATESIYTIDYQDAIAIVLGSEGSGLRRLTKEICQQLVSIPMAGTVSSLNVSVAAGVLLYEAQRQRKK